MLERNWVRKASREKLAKIEAPRKKPFSSGLIHFRFYRLVTSSSTSTVLWQKNGHYLGACVHCDVYLKVVEGKLEWAWFPSPTIFWTKINQWDQLLDNLARVGNQRTRGKHFWGRVGKNTYGTSSLIVQGKHWRKAIALATALHSHKCLVSEQDSPTARFRGFFTS